MKSTDSKQRGSSSEGDSDEQPEEEGGSSSDDELKEQAPKSLKDTNNDIGRPPLSGRKSRKSGRRTNQSTTDVVTFCTAECKYEVVKDAAKTLGWKLMKGNKKEPGRRKSVDEDSSEIPKNCNIYWVDIANIHERMGSLASWQRINHFPGMTNIARKNRMAQHLDRARRKFLSDYSFYPRTWVLPSEFADFRTQFDSSGRSNKIFILKPDGGCQGKGIMLTQSVEDVDQSVAQVAQLYMKRPLLIDGYKFDLRLYVLVSSVKPLRIYLCHDGLVRLCTEPYVAPTSDNIDDRCMHLTNYAVNKNSENFEANSGASEDEGKGSKRSLRWFMSWVKETVGDKKAQQIWERMGYVSVKTILCILPLLQKEYAALFETPDAIDCGVEGSRCFEILGMDVMIDNHYKVWLVEVNHLPSFQTDSPLDWRVKSKVVNQSLSIVRVKGSDRSMWESHQKERADRRVQNQQMRRVRNIDPSIAIKEKILAIYQTHAPDKIEKIQQLFEKYKGKEDKLLHSVEKKYTGLGSTPDPSKESNNEIEEPLSKPSTPSRSSEHSKTVPSDEIQNKSPSSMRCSKKKSINLERRISFKDVMDGSESDSDGGELFRTVSGSETPARLDCEEQTPESNDEYFISPEEDQELAFEEERLKDFDRIFPPSKEARKNAEAKMPDYQKLISWLLEQDMKRNKRMNCPIGQQARNALSYNEHGSLPEVDAKFKPEPSGGRDWGGLLNTNPNGFGWRAPTKELPQSEAPARVPGPKQAAAAERLSKGKTSQRRNQSAPSRSDGYQSESGVLSEKVIQAMEYGRLYRQKIAQRREQRSMAMVPLKINTLSLIGLPEDK